MPPTPSFPKILYKYRTCNFYGFDMLENGYLWADKPTAFLDRFDSAIHLRLQEELPQIETWLCGHLGEILYYILPPRGMAASKGNLTLQKCMDAQNSCGNRSGTTGVFPTEKQLKSLIQSLPKDQKEACSAAFLYLKSQRFETAYRLALEKSLLSVVNTLRETKKICCLTTRNDNLPMWENYADAYTGFCIAYKIEAEDRSSEQNGFRQTLFPVCYQKRIPKIDLLPFIKRSFVKFLYGEGNIDPNALQKLHDQLLFKKPDYRYEEEWRIVLDGSHSGKIPCPVSAVYAGHKISAEHAARLQESCKQKEIPYFVQKFNGISGKVWFERQ